MHFLVQFSNFMQNTKENWYNYKEKHAESTQITEVLVKTIVCNSKVSTFHKMDEAFWPWSDALLSGMSTPTEFPIPKCASREYCFPLFRRHLRTRLSEAEKIELLATQKPPTTAKLKYQELYIVLAGVPAADDKVRFTVLYKFKFKLKGHLQSFQDSLSFSKPRLTRSCHVNRDLTVFAPPLL